MSYLWCEYNEMYVPSLRSARENDDVNEYKKLNEQVEKHLTGIKYEISQYVSNRANAANQIGKYGKTLLAKLKYLQQTRRRIRKAIIRLEPQFEPLDEQDE